MKTLKVGMIGAGRIGKVHAESLVYRVPQATLVAITDHHADLAQDLATALHIPRVTPTSREIFEDASIDAVMICSSTDTHADLIVQAAEAGKHIFCEKPLDHSLARIDWALAAVEKAGVKLQVGFHRRFDANFMRIRRAVESGEIGTPHLIHMISRDPAPPPIAYIKVSGGIFLDMMIHDFDMARYLMCDEVEEVYTSAAVRVDEEIGKSGDVDTAVVMLRYRSGAIGTIDNCRKSAYGYDQRAEVFGSAGMISTGNLYPNQAVISTAAGIGTDLPLNFFMQRYPEAFSAEVRDFVNAVAEDRPTAVTGLDGRKPVAIAIAARQSFDLGRPVKLCDVA